MVSLLPRSLAIPLDDKLPTLNELGSLRNAIEPFTKQIIHSGQTTVHLHCTVPTWCLSSETCLDLHDLQELRSRFLLFIHDLLSELRKYGISASYNLAPSNSSLCVVCALPPELCSSRVKSTIINILQDAKQSNRDSVLLADFSYGSALIIT